MPPEYSAEQRRPPPRAAGVLGLLAFVAFVMVHTAMVILHNFGREMGTIIWGNPVHATLGVIIAAVAFAGIVWLRAIEFVADYRDIGQGMGGWREDYQHYDTGAGL